MEYTESEVKELLKRQRSICAEEVITRAHPKNIKRILESPEPKLKTDGNDKRA